MKTFATRLICIACLFALGCADLNTEYGVMYGRSVNGIDAFAALLRQDGHRVGITRKLSPKVMYVPDVLVLFLDSYQPLPEEQRRWLESWLGTYEGRQLILVLRDSDEEIAYWEKILELQGETLSESDKQEIESRLERARNYLKVATKEAKPRKWPEWYGHKPGDPWLRRAGSVTGPPEWTTDFGIDQGKLDLRFARRLQPGAGAKAIVKANDDVLIARRPLRDSTIWIVANGSFLLNHGLVNHEHRKLALALSRQLDANKDILFALGTEITDADEEEPFLGMFQFLTVGPVPWIAGHLVVLALLFAWLRFPIFGRPQERETREVYQFARHVDALGRMLASTRDEQAAQEMLNRFQDTYGKRSREYQSDS